MAGIRGPALCNTKKQKPNKQSKPEKQKQTSFSKKLKSQNIKEKKTKNIIISYLCIQN